MSKALIGDVRAEIASAKHVLHERYIFPVGSHDSLFRDLPPEKCALLMAPIAFKNLFHLLNHEDSTSQNLHGFVLESAFGIYFESIGLWINNKMVTRVYRAFYVNMVPDNEGCKGNIKFICN